MTTNATVPPATDPSAITPPAPVAPAAAPSVVSMDSTSFNERIAQAKKSAEAEQLKALGVATLDEVKAALAAKKSADDANKTAAEKVAELSKQNETATARATTLEAVVKERAASELATLTDAQKAAVQAVAGDDAAAQLRAIDKLKPTWTAPADPAAPIKPGAPPNTAPARTAPTGTQPVVNVDHLATYRALKETNPIAAAHYRKANADALAKAESQKT